MDGTQGLAERSDATTEDLRPLTRRLDRASALELLALVAVTMGLLGTATLQIALRAREEQDPSATTWLITAGVAALVAAAIGIGQAVAWRRAGGRPLQRLGREVWRTGRPPRDPRLRVAVLRDLQRRGRLLDREWSPWWWAGCWTVFSVVQIALQPRPLLVTIWTASAAWAIGTAVVQAADRRRAPQLRALAEELSTDPLGLR